MHPFNEKKDDGQTPTVGTALEAVPSYLKALVGCIIPQSPAVYQPLPHKDSFRLIHIQPGKEDQPLKITLHLSRLHEQDGLPSYEALSYTWNCADEPNPPPCTIQNSIICNGTTKLIRHNLFKALSQLRYRTKERIIWADAISINQEDDLEKDGQIRLMHHIYRKASRVVVWLGKDDYDEAPRAFETLCAAANTWQRGQKPYTYEVFAGKGDERQISCTHAPPPTSSKSWVAVMAFFISDYFKRLWIVQEVVLAKHAIFIWGDCSLSWSAICHGIEYIKSDPNLAKELEDRGFQNAHLMYHLSKLRLGELKATHPFLHLLDMSRSFDVTNPKDKIFGLMGFPTEDGNDTRCGWEKADTNRTIDPVYEHSVEEVYTLVAAGILQKDQNLDVLSFTSHIRPSEKDQSYVNPGGIIDPAKVLIDLPSWVPNWDSGYILSPFLAFGENNQFSTGKGAGMKPEINISVKINETNEKHGNMVCVKGLVVDTIHEVEDQRPGYISLAKATPELKKLLIWSWARKHKDTTLETFVRTLTAGRDAHGNIVQSAEQPHQTTAFCELLHELKPESITLSSLLPTEIETLDRKKFNTQLVREMLWKASCYRSAFVTEGGELGMGSSTAMKGDKVVVLYGGQVPYVIREQEGGWYKFVGECYVNSLMNGDAIAKGDGIKDTAEMGVERLFELR